MTEDVSVKPLIVCADCRTELRLFGIEHESGVRDLYTFECPRCGRLKVRGVLVGLPYEHKPG